MNITEATATNDILDLLFGRRRVDGEHVTSGEAYAAAELLAQRAYKALSAGLREDDVARLWPQAMHRRLEAALALLEQLGAAETVGPLTVAALRRALTGEAGTAVVQASSEEASDG